MMMIGIFNLMPDQCVANRQHPSSTNGVTESGQRLGLSPLPDAKAGNYTIQEIMIARCPDASQRHN